jgi:hypothetical protein
MNIELNREGAQGDRESDLVRRFYVRAPSVSTVRRALHRAPGGARVVGRYDRDTIECVHTMNEQSHDRYWPIIASRLEKAGLRLVERP